MIPKPTPDCERSGRGGDNLGQILSHGLDHQLVLSSCQDHGQGLIANKLSSRIFIFVVEACFINSYNRAAVIHTAPLIGKLRAFSAS